MSQFVFSIELIYTNTILKQKSFLNKHTAEPYLIYGDQIGETEKVKKKIHIYIYINNVSNLF